MNRNRMRQVWLKLHLLLGLTAGTLLVLLGLTGSAIVFFPRLDAMLAADVLTVRPGAAKLPVGDVLDAARASYPGTAQPTWILLPEIDNGATIIRYDEPRADGAVDPVWYAMDPYTAQPLGQRIWGDDAMSWLYELHHSLHLGDAGEAGVGVIGILLIVSLLSGLYLWWPTLRTNARRALSVKWRFTTAARRDRDLHNVGGAYGFAVLMLIAVTGTFIVFQPQLQPLVERIAVTTPYPSVASAPLAGAPDVGVNRAVAAAAGVFPEGELRFVALPMDDAGVYTIFMRQPGEWGGSSAQSLVWVDRWSGAVSASRDWHALTLADRLIAAAAPIHSGDAFGLVGRWIVFASGFLPLLFFITGLRMWRRKAVRVRDRGVVAVELRHAA